MDADGQALAKYVCEVCAQVCDLVLLFGVAFLVKFVVKFGVRARAPSFRSVVKLVVSTCARLPEERK